MFRRANGVYYLHHNETGQQKSLATMDEQEANRLFHAANEARQTPALNIELGKAYLRGSNPALVTRTWKTAMDELCSHGKSAKPKALPTRT